MVGWALIGAGAVAGAPAAPVAQGAKAAGKPVPPSAAHPTPPLPPPGAGGTAAPAAPPAFDLNAAQQAVVQLANQLPSITNDARLGTMGEQAAAIEAQANKVVAIQDVALAGVDRDLRRYTPPPRHRLSESETKKQAPLLVQRDALSAQIAQAQAVAANARRTFSEIAERRREGFSARILERSPSPLTPDFWGSLGSSAAADLDRTRDMAERSLDVAARAPIPRGPLGLGAGLIAALIIMWPLRRWMERWGRRKRTDPTKGAQARRTLSAVWIASVDIGAPTLAAAVIHVGCQWGRLLTTSADAVAASVVGAVAWAAAIIALGRVMATDREPGRRF